MRSGVPLATLRQEVLLEAGLSSDTASTVQWKPVLDQMINRVERLIAMRYDWGALTFEEEVTVLADQQYASLPSNITFTQVERVDVLLGTQWLPVAHGIGPAERSLYPSTARATPIARWEIQAPGTTQFEVWPIGSVDQTLRFSGQKTIGGMVDDRDTCTLDGDGIVLWVAAEILAKDRKEDAQVKMNAAVSHLNRIAMKQGVARMPVASMAGGEPERVLRPGIDYVPPG